MATNKIITRGLGLSPRNRLITQGYGGPPSFVAQTITAITTRRHIAGGGTGKRRVLAELEEVIVWAKLIEVNNMPPKKKIEGKIRVQVKKGEGTKVLAERISQRVVKTLERIKVTVKRIK